MNESFDVRKKYCPAKQKNVIVKVHRPDGWEECTETEACRRDGGCRNRYLYTEESVSHSV